jgi:hypothetical protein
MQQLKKSAQGGNLPTGLMGSNLSSNLPFQFINPQNPQMPNLGMFPMMQGIQFPTSTGAIQGNK